VGVGAALNAGLAVASGALIAYLDDDNAMLPHWLAAVVWAFAEHPAADVLYGARLMQLDDRGIPDVHLLPWDRRSLERFNISDQNVTAHRAGLAGTTYDPTLRSATDWDFLLRMTEHKAPLRLPVLAVAYRRDAPNRSTDRPDARVDYVRVQQRALRRRPLRVLGVNAMFPLVTETYIHDELHALEQQGARLAWFRAQPAPAPMPVSQPVYDDIDEAVREFDPDLLMVYWLDYAAGELERLERLGRPFGVRAHSFDRYPDLAERLAAHPLCLGVWTYPRSPFAEMGTHTLVPIFSSVDRLPEPAPERDVIASMSAGLPKKDWPLLFEAFGRLSGHDRRVVVGVTVGHEEVPGELAALAAACPDPPRVQLNLVREETHALLMRTSVLVYTLRPEVGFAMPMSVVEALCAGCCVVLPDRPECREFAGPGFRGYRTADDIVRHVLEVRAGGPAIDAEREANRAWGRERFCDPELGRRFHAELLAAMDDMRAAAMGLPLPSLTGAGDTAQAERASAAISLA
jgi:glycosyltransferase involved in cell wall biosynthesis